MDFSHASVYYIKKKKFRFKPSFALRGYSSKAHGLQLNIPTKINSFFRWEASGVINRELLIAEVLLSLSF